jgi:hypothetical protein
MSGTVASTDARFHDPTSKTSAHYGVELNGSVVQWVRETDTAYHSDSRNVNLSSIGIEHEDGGDTEAPRTDALYAASAALVSDICQRYGIPIDRRWVIKHSEVPDATTACPDALDVDRIVRTANAMSPSTPPQSASRGGPDPSAPQNRPETAAGTDGTAPPAAAIVPPQLGVNALKDIASTVYNDTGRWLDIYHSIQSVVDEVPMVKLLTKMLAEQPGGPGAPTPETSNTTAPATTGPTTTTAGPTATPGGGKVPPDDAWGGSQPAIFSLQILYLTLLATLAIIFFTNRDLIDLPSSLGPVPVPVPWFGALGAVLISLVGVTQHRHDWDPGYRFWHWARPLLGASFGAISVLIFEAGILAVGTAPSASTGNIPKDLLYYLIAFLVGYREETFRELVKRLTDIVFSPGQSGGTVVVNSMAPQVGSAAGGTTVTLLGNGFDNTDNVRYGSAQAQFHIDGDGQLTVTSPPGLAGSTVNVAVATKSASVIAGAFTYN